MLIDFVAAGYAAGVIVYIYACVCLCVRKKCVGETRLKLWQLCVTTSGQSVCAQGAVHTLQGNMDWLYRLLKCVCVCVCVSVL